MERIFITINKGLSLYLFIILYLYIYVFITHKIINYTHIRYIVVYINLSLLMVAGLVGRSVGRSMTLRRCILRERGGHTKFSVQMFSVANCAH